MSADSCNNQVFDPSVLGQLACPACRGQLRFEATRLLCVVCGRAFSIIDGIPVLIAERAVSSKSYSVWEMPQAPSLRPMRTVHRSTQSLHPAVFPIGRTESERNMAGLLWTIFVILLILWIVGFALHVAGSLIHLLLVIALVILIVNLVTGRRR